MIGSALVTSAVVSAPAPVAAAGRGSAPSQQTPEREGPEAAEAARTEEPGELGAAERTERESSPDGLTAKERRIVAELERIDRQVRAHEQAHLAAAGGLARGVSFRFATGPNGKRYAVAGEVRIDTAPVEGRPEATIRKAQQVKAAANAPANPSAQDRAVAAQAAAMEAQARQELFAERRQTLEQHIRDSQAQSFAGEGVSLGTILSAVG